MTITTSNYRLNNEIGSVTETLPELGFTFDAAPAPFSISQLVVDNGQMSRSP